VPCRGLGWETRAGLDATGQGSAGARVRIPVAWQQRIRASAPPPGLAGGVVIRAGGRARRCVHARAARALAWETVPLHGSVTYSHATSGRAPGLLTVRSRETPRRCVDGEAVRGGVAVALGSESSGVARPCRLPRCPPSSLAWHGHQGFRSISGLVVM
jgi:hypothetical protein